MNQKPEFPDNRHRAFFDAMTNRRDELRDEGTRADVNELNRRNRELLAANVKLQDENQALRRRLRARGEHA